MMWLGIKQFIAIARVTSQEGARQPITILLTGSGVLLVALLPFLITHQLGEAGRLVRDGSLSLHLVLGLLLSAHLACSVFQHEMNKGTAGAILCKPVNRSVFFLAKVAGVSIVVLAFCICMICSTLLASAASTERFFIQWSAELPLLLGILLAILLGGIVNFWKKVPFPSVTLGFLLRFLLCAVVAGAMMMSGDVLVFPWPILPAGLLISSAVFVFTGLACSLAPVFGTLATMTLCGGIFLFGLTVDYLIGSSVGRLGGMAHVLSVLPNWQRFWVVDALAGGGKIPWLYTLTACGYAGLYLAAVLCMGVCLFRRVEVQG